MDDHRRTQQPWPWRGLGIGIVIAAVAWAAPPVAAQPTTPQFAQATDSKSPRGQQRQKKQASEPAQAQENRRPPQQPTDPAAIETSAKQAIIVDFQTGKVLFEKAADERMPPSSMSKIMTGYMVFKQLKAGAATLEDMFPVSERAWRMQGSKTFVPLGERVKIEDLIRGMIVQSGNDACIVLAEGFAGSEQAFAEQMSEEGKRIGLTASSFRNSTGWPEADHLMTARDLATLAKRVISDFPEYYKYYSELNYSFNGIKQGNRNPLLYKSLGADGLKTGHTEAAGYGLTASAIRDGRRIIMVINGLPSIKARAEESERLIEWAFREFSNYKLFAAGAPIEKADVWLGDQATVALTVPQDAIVTMARRARPQMKVTLTYDAPIPAPIAKGTRIGSIHVTAPGIEPTELPLIAGEDVGRLGPLGRLTAAAGYFIWGGSKR